MTARILDVRDSKVRITMRGGPLERPEPFRRPPTREEVEAYSAWDVEHHGFMSRSFHLWPCGVTM